MTDSLDPNNELVANLRNQLREVIRGNDEVIDILVISLLAGGSVLIEDVPGVGKTTLAKALSLSITGEFRRIQFTPDLLPADILGGSVYNPVDGTFSFRKGPIFCNVLLADEINRASPRTQSALLEGMNESQVTIEGQTHPLPSPFFVIATQNPLEFHGTYPLPEAQLDRFLTLLEIGYPERSVEVDILYSQIERHPITTISPVLALEDVIEIQSKVRKVNVDRSVGDYMVRITEATRNEPRIKLGASPRGSLMLFRAAQASALSSGREYVLPDDVQRLAPYVLSHRIILDAKAKYGGASPKKIIQDILEGISVPT
jgi:MoxR-like ATPase